MYISKREQKRRLQKLWHKSAEEQMQEYYLQQEKRAITVNMPHGERHVFESCQGRPIRKRVKNSFSKEEAGTCGNVITVKRFQGSRLTCVCKSRIY